MQPAECAPVVGIESVIPDAVESLRQPFKKIARLATRRMTQFVDRQQRGNIAQERSLTVPGRRVRVSLLPVVQQRTRAHLALRAAAQPAPIGWHKQSRVTQASRLRVVRAQESL